jgi:hypothetical protein
VIRMGLETIPRLVLLAILVGGCATGGTRSPSSSASSSFSSEPSRSAVVRTPLPSGFPVVPGAAPVPPPDDDSGLIALWESDQAGSAAYDFYVDALPAAGYPIVGLYPGGAVAVIRFLVPDGQVWQMVAHGMEGGTVGIEVRLDRP